MFWAGEEGGTAVADLLFGDHNPGGKLPYTVYAGERDLPPMSSFSLPAEHLAYWDSNQEMWVVKPGAVDAMVGSGSDDIRQKAQFQITTAGQWPPGELTTRVSLGK
jgi:hypothetical protein